MFCIRRWLRSFVSRSGDMQQKMPGWWSFKERDTRVARGPVLRACAEIGWQYVAAEDRWSILADEPTGTANLSLGDYRPFRFRTIEQADRFLFDFEASDKGRSDKPANWGSSVRGSNDEASGCRVPEKVENSAAFRSQFHPAKRPQRIAERFLRFVESQSPSRCFNETSGYWERTRTHREVIDCTFTTIDPTAYGTVDG